jgi:hypothetical protein
MLQALSMPLVRCSESCWQTWNQGKTVCFADCLRSLVGNFESNWYRPRVFQIQNEEIVDHLLIFWFYRV